MIKVKVLAFLFAGALAAGVAESRMLGNKAKMPWANPADASALQKAERRPIIVDVYTNWCYYCKLMDATTWSNDSVVNYLNQKFHSIKFNAEERNPVNWFGKEYAYKSNYKVNMLTIELLKGQLAYPSTVIIPEKGDWEIIPGAFKPKEIEIVLKYFGERANERMDFATFQKGFSGKWR